ncbi:MAG: glycosyltransferase family 1 protein [Patescibacteria group bacterium]
MLKIGIECESLEGKRFGVGQTLIQLLEAISKLPGIENEFRFYLYFKKEIPKDAILEDSVFVKKILKFPLLPASFNVFYHILLPLAYWRDKLNLLFFPSYMLPAFFVGKAVVVLTNDVYYESHFGNLPFKYRLSYRLFAWLAARRAEKIMTISNFAKSELMKFYKIPERNIFVNPWGLHPKFKVLDKTREILGRLAEIKKNLGVQDDFIISIGQAFPRRHVKESMLAFEKVAGQFKNAQYIVACADKYNPPVLDNLAKEINGRLGREVILRVNYFNDADIPLLFNSALLLAYVSTSEALGLPPVEALKCGTPSVVADNPLTREIFENSAFFVKNPDNIDEIARKMEEGLMNKPRIIEIKESAEKVAAKFSWQSCAENLVKVFKEIA